MARRVSTVGSAFSWADEVEKEEEEARVELHNKKQKPNPFGSARPREVVLQEKGIDWRKLDHNLHNSSHHLKEKLLKECNPAPAAPAPPPPRPPLNGRSIPQCKGRGQKLRNPPIPPNPHQIAHDENVSPLRYPPKNFITPFGDYHDIYKPHGIVGLGKGNFPQETYIDSRKEKAVYNPERETFHKSKNQKFPCYETPHDQHSIRYFDAGMSDHAMEALRDVRNLRNPATHEEEWLIADSKYTTRSSGYNFVGSPWESENIRDSIRRTTQNGRKRSKGFDSSRNGGFQESSKRRMMSSARENNEFDEEKQWSCNTKTKPMLSAEYKRREMELGSTNNHYHHNRRR